MSDPIPIILCGHTSQIALGVKANLQPEYEGSLNLPIVARDSLTQSL